jgi:hypothetical protein
MQAHTSTMVCPSRASFRSRAASASAFHSCTNSPPAESNGASTATACCQQLRRGTYLFVGLFPRQDPRLDRHDTRSLARRLGFACSRAQRQLLLLLRPPRRPLPQDACFRLRLLLCAHALERRLHSTSQLSVTQHALNCTACSRRRQFQQISHKKCAATVPHARFSAHPSPCASLASPARPAPPAIAHAGSDRAAGTPAPRNPAEAGQLVSFVVHGDMEGKRFLVHWHARPS